MARPRGRPKIVGKWQYQIHYGNPLDTRLEIKHTATEARRFVEKVFKSQDEQARRMCTKEEYKALVAVIQSASQLRSDEDHEYWSIPRGFTWSFQWGDHRTMKLHCIVTRVETANAK